MVPECKTKKQYEAEAALLNFVESIMDNITAPVKKKSDKIYCYCNIKGAVAFSGLFCTKGDKAFELADIMAKTKYAEFVKKIEEHLAYIRHVYSYCTDIMPSELFLEFDAVNGNTHGLMHLEGFSSTYDAKIRYKAWFEEHGGKGKEIGPRYDDFGSKLKWKLFKLGEEKVINPTADATEIDMEVLRASREKTEEFAEEACEAELDVAYDYLEGDTGFLAIKAAFDEQYTEESCLAILYYDTVADMRIEYNLPRKEYPYTLYEYIAVYDVGDSWHIVSLGMSELGAERDDIYKRYDAEYTMRIPKIDDEDMDEAEWANAINLVSILADEACNKERMLEDYSYVGLGFRKGVDYKRESDKVAFIIVPDARISSVEGPFGTVHLRQAVPISKSEYDALKSKKIDVKTLYEKIGTDLVDFDRPSVI